MPATPSAVTHLATVGQPTYDAVNKAVSLESTSSSGSDFRGTEYRIAYNFTQGYTYSITVNAVSFVVSGGAPKLRLRLTPSTSTSTLCNGPQVIDQATTGTLTQTNQVNTNSNIFYDIVYNFPSISSANSYLTIANLPIASEGLKTILIRKITITETAPAASFTLSPTSVPKVCGTALTQTFTVTNVNNTPGVSSYVWNLGAANGWKYNNAAAPTSITTPTNTLTLTADACVSSLANVSASAVIGSTSYSAGTATVSLTMPSMAINGVDPLCTSTGSYSVSNVPCNATVSWTSSNTSAATVPATGNPVTVTKVGNGAVTLTATVTACGNTITLTKNIRVGVYGPSDYTVNGPLPSNPSCGQYVYFNTNTLPGATSYSWQYPGTWQASGQDTYSLTLLIPSGTIGVYQVGVRVGNACGAGGSYAAKPFNVSCSGFAPVYTVSPNPATNEITIAKATNVIASNSKTAKTALGTITQINIYDQLGSLKKQQKFSSQKQIKVNINSLHRGFYFLEIVDADHRERHQLSVVK